MNIDKYLEEHNLVAKSYCEVDGCLYLLCKEKNNEHHTGDSNWVIKIDGDNIEAETALGSIINWGFSLKQDWIELSK